MEQFSKGVHRALIVPNVGDEATGVKFLTQTAVASFLLDHRSTSASLQDIFNQPVGQFQRPNVVTITSGTSLLVALQIMQDANVYAAAIVDKDTGVLISTLSVSDLRGTGNWHFLMKYRSSKSLDCVLFLYSGFVTSALRALSSIPVVDFLRHKNGIPAEGLLPTPLTFRSDDRLGDVVGSMLSSHYHRSWKVDDHGRPTDVMTLTDVIRGVWEAERKL
jgi:CBS-domain-containing membrane protein